MNAPKRIQRKRTKGWRMPEGAIYVGRPSRWQNHFRVIRDGSLMGDPLYRVTITEGRAAPIDRFLGGGHELPHARRQAADLFRHDLLIDFSTFADMERDYLGPLRGHDLACWCPLDQPCHADVLLELANRSAS